MLCQPHSVSLCQCEVGDLRRSLYTIGVSIFGNVVNLWVKSELLEACPSALLACWESVFMFQEGLLPHCSLWVKVSGDIDVR